MVYKAKSRGDRKVHLFQLQFRYGTVAWNELFGWLLAAMQLCSIISAFDRYDRSNSLYSLASEFVTSNRLESCDFFLFGAALRDIAIFRCIV